MDGPESADGTLIIMVCRAKHLPNRRKLDKQSPYVLLRIGTTAKKTPSHFRAGQTPEWTHEIRFQLSRDRKPILKLDVLDETKNDPTPIGNTEIDCSHVFLDPANLQNGGKYILDNWYELTCNNRQAGMIYLEMTFYPSAPVLPPKVSMSSVSSEPRDLPPIPDSDLHRLDPVNIADDVFVSGDYKKKSSFFRHSDPSPPKDDSVFVSGLPKKSGRFAAFKSKFKAKEPISSIWSEKQKLPAQTVAVDDIITPTMSPIDNLDRLRADIGVISPPAPTPPPHSPLTYSAPGSYSIDSRTKSPPHTPVAASHPHRNFPGTPFPPKSGDLYSTPDQYSTSSDRYSSITPELSQSQYSEQNMFPRSDYGYPNDRISPNPRLSPGRLSPDRLSPDRHPMDRPARLSPRLAGNSKLTSPRRKPPPPDMSDDFSKLKLSLTTSIPFSADSFGLDDDDENDALPTQVFHLGQKVQSLTHSAKDNTHLNPNDIDPKYYAPSPSEQMAKSWRLQNGQANKNDLKVDLNTETTGYLGDGKWQANRFSPSVFLRINDENSEKENKPAVPPKIPRGLSELEYFVLEKEAYLKDINGRRI